MVFPQDKPTRMGALSIVEFGGKKQASAPKHACYAPLDILRF